MKRLRRVRGTVQLGALAFLAGVGLHVASNAVLLRYVRAMQAAQAAGLERPPEPSVVLMSVLTYGTLLLVAVGVHLIAWAPPRNGVLYLPVRLLLSAALGVGLFFGMVYVAGIVLALIVA